MSIAAIIISVFISLLITPSARGCGVFFGEVLVLDGEGVFLVRLAVGSPSAEAGDEADEPYSDGAGEASCSLLTIAWVCNERRRWKTVIVNEDESEEGM